MRTRTSKTRRGPQVKCGLTRAFWPPDSRCNGSVERRRPTQSAQDRRRPRDAAPGIDGARRRAWPPTRPRGPQRVRVATAWKLHSAWAHTRPSGARAPAEAPARGGEVQERYFPRTVQETGRSAPRARRPELPYLARRRRRSPRVGRGHQRRRAGGRQRRREGELVLAAGPFRLDARGQADARLVERLQGVRLVALAVVAAQADALDLRESLLRLAQGVIIRVLLVRTAR